MQCGVGGGVVGRWVWRDLANFTSQMATKAGLDQAKANSQDLPLVSLVCGRYSGT